MIYKVWLLILNYIWLVYYYFYLILLKGELETMTHILEHCTGKSDLECTIYQAYWERLHTIRHILHAQKAKGGKGKKKERDSKRPLKEKDKA